MKLIVPVVLLFHIHPIQPWDLSTLGVGTHHHVRHVTVYEDRAYLAVHVHTPHGDVTTLVEAPWPEESRKSWRPREVTAVVPRTRCAPFYGVVATDVDRLGRLWILDGGGGPFDCPPQLVVYSLRARVALHRFTMENGSKLASVVVDKTRLDPSAYVGLRGEEGVYVCRVKNPRCGYVGFNATHSSWCKDELGSTEALAVSGSDDMLYVTSGDSLGMYRIAMKALRNHKTAQPLSLDHVGDKLGASSGLLIDSHSNMCYYLRRDYAIACWNMRLPFTAEGHVIIMQSYSILSNVTELFLDGQNHMWALVDENNVEIKKYKQKQLKYSPTDFLYQIVRIY